MHGRKALPRLHATDQIWEEKPTAEVRASFAFTTLESEWLRITL